MSTLTISKENALAAHKNADKHGKALLENLFGKQILPGKITDRVKSFEDICQIADVDPKGFIIPKDADSLLIGRMTFDKLQLIYDVVNRDADWEADFGDSNQGKYCPWFEYTPGSGFSCNDYGYTHTNARVGARLCTYSREMAEWIGRTFIKEYNDYLIKTPTKS